MTASNPNLEILELAVARLDHLVDQLVFLGGCATGLLITDQGAPPVRATIDVDVITETATLIDYYKLSDQLRGLGFTEDCGPEAPICRWRVVGSSWMSCRRIPPSSGLEIPGINRPLPPP